MAIRGLQFARVFAELELNTKEFQADLAQSEKSLGRLTNFITANPMAAAGSFAAVLVTVGVKATEMAIEVDRSLKRIGASLPEAKGKVAELRDEMIRLSVESGRPAAQLSEAALQVARGGVGSLQDLQAALRASAQTADATGEDLNGIVGGLDKVLDLFGLSGRDAERVLARLFATAQGKASITELLDAFDRLGPVIQKRGVDFQTTAEALATLIDRGFTTKQIVSQLSGLDVKGIRELAAQSHVAGDGMDALREAAKSARGELDVLIDRDMNRLNGALIQIGATIKPLAEKGLGAVATGLEAIARRSDLIAALATFNASGVALAIARGPTPGTPEEGPDGHIPGRHGDPLRARRPPLPVSEEELKKAAEAAAKLRQQITAAFTDTLPTTVDATTTSIEHLAIELAKAGAPAAEVSKALNPLIDQLDKLRDQALAEQIKQTLASVELSSGDSLDRQTTLLEGAVDRLRDLRAQRVDTLTDQTGPIDVNVLGEIATLDQQIEETNKRLVAVRKEGAAAAEKTEQADDGAAEALRKAREEIERSKQRVTDIARGIGDVARGAIGAAQAFGAMTDATAAALQNVITIVDTLPGLMSEISHIGDVGNVFDLTSFAGGVTGLIGGLAGLASSIFGGGESPEEKRLRETLDHNAEVIAEATRKIGDFGLNITGNVFAGLRQALQGQAFAGGLAGTLGGQGLSIAQLNADLARLGLSMTDLRAAAHELGIEFANTMPSLVELQQLLRVIQETELAQFADTLQGRLKALDAEAEFFGLTAQEQLERLARELGGTHANPVTGAITLNKDAAPAIARALQGLDLSLAKDREEFKRRLGELIKALETPGGLTAAELGGLTPEEFLAELLKLGGFIDQANQAGDTGSSSNFVQENRITETTGARLTGILESGLVEWRETAENTAKILEALRAGLVTQLVSPPALPASIAAGDGSRVQVNLGGVTITLVAQPGQPASQSLQVAEALADQVERVLGERLNDQQARMGRTLQ